MSLQFLGPGTPQLDAERTAMFGDLPLPVQTAISALELVTEVTDQLADYCFTGDPAVQSLALHQVSLKASDYWFAP